MYYKQASHEEDTKASHASKSLKIIKRTLYSCNGAFHIVEVLAYFGNLGW